MDLYPEEGGELTERDGWFLRRLKTVKVESDGEQEGGTGVRPE